MVILYSTIASKSVVKRHHMTERGAKTWPSVSHFPHTTLPLLSTLMANLTRSAKSGSKWTLTDLESYHISLNQVDPLPFFGVEVGKDGFLQSSLMTFCVIGVATTLG